MITVHNDGPLGMGAHNGPDLHSYSRSHPHPHTQTLRWKWQEWKCQCRCLLPRARSVPNRSIEALLLLLATVLLVVATNPVLAWTAVPATTTHRGSGRSRSILRSISRSLPRQSTSTTRLEWSATNNSTDREPHNTATIGSNSNVNSNSNNDCLILVDADATFQAIPVLWNGTDDENKNKYNEEEDDSPNEASSLAAATTTTTTTTSSSNYQTAELELELEETEKALVATATPSYTTKATTTTNNNNNIEQATETPATPSDSSTTTTIREIAIVLNTNARGVTDDLVKAAREVVRDRNDAAAAAAAAVGGGGAAAAAAAPVRVRVLVTSTHDEARAAARDIASNGHKTLVIPVGGDGTLTTTINLLWKERSAFLSSHSGSSSTGSNGNGNDNGGNDADADVASRDSFPFLFGYVAMGTGNALGSVVGCRPVAGAAAAAAAAAENGRNNNNNNNNNKRRRKRPRAITAAAATVTRAWNKAVRPNRTKREEFKLVLEQLIEATATKQKQKQKRPTMAPPRAKQSFPSITTTDGPSSIGTDIDIDMNVDIVDLPLIHVRTTKVGSTTAVGAKDKKVVEEDHYAFFAGLGYDSLILQDYMDLQQQDNRNHSTAVGRLRRLATTGVLGYTVAMMTRSLPRVLKLTDASRLLRDVRITTDQPESAFWIDHRRGDLMRPAAAASAAVATDGVSAGNSNNNEQLLLYRGSAGIVAAGSVPYYGGGLRMFPFARMTPNGMHLRIGRRLHPIEGILSIPSIFKGSFRDHEFKCLDFVGNRFAVEIYESYSTDNSSSSSSNDSDADSENPLAGESGLNVFERKSSRTEAGFPVQHSGESVGRCTRVEFTVSSSSTAEDARSGSGTTDTRSRAAVPPPVRFVTLMPSRIVEERIDLDP